MGKNMEIVGLKYTMTEGWSSEFPDLDSENTLILVFAAPEFVDNPSPLKALKQHYPKSKIIGCSSAGEIYGPYVFDHSLSVSITKFHHTPIKIIKQRINDPKDSFEVGKSISTSLYDKNLKNILIFSDGLKVNGSELSKGLNDILKNKNIIITGGLAGDGANFKRTFSIFDGEMISDHIIGIGFYGDHLQVGHASGGGWDIFGPERRITKSKNNVLYELDQKPALELYKEYLGEKSAGLPATGLLFPLCIRKDLNDQKQLVRTILSIDEKEKSLTFAGDIPEGYLAQLMKANFERIICCSADTADRALNMMHSKEAFHTPLLSIPISCVGRKLILGERIDEETESLLEILPKDSVQVGFYSYGELSPYLSGECNLHNQTMTLTLLYEKE